MLAGPQQRPNRVIPVPKKPLKIRQPATLADVAALANVDPSTVSRVLRDDAGHRVGVLTREKVHKAAAQLAYRPNEHARGLRLSRSQALGFVVPQLDNPVFSDSVLAAERAARERGYSLLLMHVSADQADANVYRNFAESHRIDGLLVAAQETDTQLVDELRQVRIPTIVLNRRVAGIRSFVALESESAARIATEHLLQLGHRRIAHLAGNPAGFNGKQRLAGFRAAMKSAAIPVERRWLQEAGYTFTGGAQMMQRILDQPPPWPTAVFAATLLSAAGAMSVLHRNAILIPDEMSVISLHDGRIAEMVYPALTTVRLPVAEMGRQAVDGLIDILEGKCTSISAMLAPETLILRASTAKPPATI